MNSYEQDFELVDLYAPTYILPVRALERPREIYSWFKKAKIYGCVYGIYYKDTPIKFGYSYPKEERINNNVFGERLVRQLSHCPGWEHQFGVPNRLTGFYKPNYGWLPDSTNGEDFFDNLQYFSQENRLQISKENLYVKIWNITNIHSNWCYFEDNDDGKKFKGEYFEAVLVQQYKNDNVNKLPIGNRSDDPTLRNHAFTKSKILKSAMECFEFS
jgi:hypothetical protein